MAYEIIVFMYFGVMYSNENDVCGVTWIHRNESTYLSWKSKTCSDATHRQGNKMIQIPVCWCLKFQGLETYVIQSLVINTESLVCVFDQLMKRQNRIIRFYYGIGHPRRRDHAEGVHYPVGVFFIDLCQQQRPHSWACPTSQRVGKLKPLQTLAVFGLPAYIVQYSVQQFCAFGVMAFCPVVSRATVT